MSEKMKWERDYRGWCWGDLVWFYVLRVSGDRWRCQINIPDGVAVFTGAHDTPDAARDAMRGLLHPDSPLIPGAVWEGLVTRIDPSPWVARDCGWDAEVIVDGRRWLARVSTFDNAELLSPTRPIWRIAIDGGLPELRAAIAGCEAVPSEVHAMLAHDLPVGPHWRPVPRSGGLPWVLRLPVLILPGCGFVPGGG